MHFSSFFFLSFSSLTQISNLSFSRLHFNFLGENGIAYRMSSTAHSIFDTSTGSKAASKLERFSKSTAAKLSETNNDVCWLKHEQCENAIQTDSQLHCRINHNVVFRRGLNRKNFFINISKHDKKKTSFELLIVS